MIFKADMVYRYGWRYQIGPWVRRGYRVVVPDMLGYGGTQKPIEAQSIHPRTFVQIWLHYWISWKSKKQYVVLK